MCAVPNIAAFCSSLTLGFPGMLLMCFLNDFEITVLLLLLLLPTQLGLLDRTQVLRIHVRVPFHLRTERDVGFKTLC